MLETKNICKIFNSSQVLKDISFTVNKGEIFGVIGPNGAGKTTILRIILGILNASAGSVWFNGNNLDQSFFNLTGYLPEERGLYPKSNVINTLVYLGQLKGLNYNSAIKKIEYWLERLELKNYKKYNIEELSKGNQQKIQFISAILHDPEILILDEPFSGFDPVNQSIFRDIIEEKKNERYIILSTHLMDLAESLCDDIFLINEGQKVLAGNLSSILNSGKITPYQISFKNELTKNNLEVFSNYNLLKTIGNSLTIDLGNNDPSNFLREVSSKLDLVSFTKIKPSLHQIFISSVEKKNTI